MNKSSLIKELFANIKTTGAVTFSSKSLVNKMLSFADFEGAKIIVELGGGDGSITRGIINRMDEDSILLVFEISKPFCENLKKEFPQDNVHIICDSAENMDQYLEGKSADLILSSLPFSLIPKESRNEIYKKSRSHLNQNGYFIQICYSYLLKFQFANYFQSIRTAFTLKNFPPAFIIICN
ncbi:methyltransferase domain-containing protein [Echinicola sp. CAU 1574]|uniref:Methyltransferase domain-containing protein n=1 Tax=Echinicola arenosa TaxID=2774144 RepID=A0ABR9AKB9_9BACT|nr:methyltransferase domain-containing protein [Echinicola arenosa]MBD8489267.1 methyltransferase domain-containing protein [Echinicola arenosa]